MAAVSVLCGFGLHANGAAGSRRPEVSRLWTVPFTLTPCIGLLTPIGLGPAAGQSPALAGEAPAWTCLVALPGAQSFRSPELGVDESIPAD